MKMFAAFSVALGLTLSAAPQVEAGGVTVKNAHICCGACVKAVKNALGDVKGVSNASADGDTKTITFEAANDAAAKKGIRALAKAGFHGTAAHGDKKLEYPKIKAKKGQSADKVVFANVHLCCGACVKGAKACMDGVKNVQTIEVDTNGKTVTLSGKGIDLLEAVTALNKGGFHAKLKGNKKK